MTHTYYAGIDLGTSSVKVVITDDQGRIAARGSASYPMDHPSPLMAEQNPALWWQAVVTAFKAALALLDDPGQLAAIGLCGQMHGTVLLDAAGNVLAPAITWADQRSHAQVNAIRQALPAPELFALAGGPPAAGFQAATARWLHDHRPDLMARVAHVALPKDYIRWRLTGVWCTDPSDASGTYLMDIASRAWSDTLLELAALRRDQLPDILPSPAVVGRLQPDAAAQLGLSAEVRVVNGAADTASSALCAGALNSDTLLLTLSTGGQLVLPVPTPLVDPQGRIHTLCAAADSHTAGWYLLGGTLSAGMALRWLRDQVLGQPDDPQFDQLCESAAAVPPGAAGLLFLPYLVGERTPHMDPHARGVFFGLAAHHGQRDLVRAVMEGVALGCYEGFQVFTEISPTPRQLILAGGGARFPLWRQIVADVFGLPTAWLEVEEQSASGAALIAAAGVNQRHLSEMAPKTVAFRETLQPDMQRSAFYQEHLLKFKRLYQTLRSLF